MLRRASTKSGSPVIFNRQVKQLQRIRAAKETEADYIKDEVANRLIDRLLFLKRDFNHVLDLGGGNGHLARALQAQKSEKIKRLTVTDLAVPLLNRDKPEYGFTVDRQYLDEEEITFPDESMDAVVSNLSLHWVNTLPDTLSSIARILKPDAPFLGTMFGGDTLFELRTSLQLAENDRFGGLSPRVSPMTDVKDVGSLLNRAGFKLTTIDVDDIVVEYPDIFALMADLQRMGESNAIFARQTSPISRDLLLAADAIYRELHGTKDAIPATFHVIYMIGWRPGDATPVPKARGSGQASLKTVLS